MRTIHIALMGAEGEHGYRPICQQTVELGEKDPCDALSLVRRCKGGVRKHVPDRFRTCTDPRDLDAARAWGYERVYVGDNGYVLWTSSATQRSTPDPDYAWWLRPHDVKAIREAYLKPPITDQPDTRTEHPHRRTDGMTYQLEDKEKIKNRCAELLSEHGIVCAETVRVVLSIHGDSLDTLNDILEHETGENDIMDYFADELEAAGLVSRADEQEDDDDEDTGSDEQ